MSRLRTIFVAACSSVILEGCGGSARAPNALSAASEPRWQDLFRTPRELVVMARPQALRESATYGPLLRRAIDLVRRRSRVVAATRAMEVFAESQTVLLSVDSTVTDDEQSDERDDDFVAVLLGVRADVDPAAVVDADGHPLWTAGPSGPVRELVRDHDEDGRPLQASLFELPGRIWVIGSGIERERAREAFAHPGRGSAALPAASTDSATGLAALRIDGRAFVAHVPALRPPSSLSLLGVGLKVASFELLAAGDRPLQARFVYASPAAAAAAETMASLAVLAMRHKKPEGFAWIGDAQVSRPAPSDSGVSSQAGEAAEGPAGATLVVSAPLPAELLSALLQAGSPSAPKPPASTP